MSLNQVQMFAYLILSWSFEERGDKVIFFLWVNRYQMTDRIGAWIIVTSGGHWKTLAEIFGLVEGEILAEKSSK